MTYLLIENQLFPCIDCFKMLVKNPNLILEQYENYQKMSFRNRYVIFGANGLIQLSIPIVGGRNQKQLSKDVQIDYTEKWPLKHWRAITSSYNKSPYFEFYEESLKKVLFSGKKNLSEFNLTVLHWCLNQLKLEVEILFTIEYKKECNNCEDYRNFFLPKNFQNIESYKYLKYPQVFENRFGFQPNLSVLDLLFAEGLNAKNLLL